MSLADFRQIAESPFGMRLPGYLAAEAPLLARLNFAVLHTRLDFGFVSSDNPVVWWVRAAGGRCTPGHFGLGHEAIEVTLPVSPHACLFFTALNVGGHIEVRDEVVRDLNSRVLSCCRERFIADRGTLEFIWPR